MKNTKIQEIKELAKQNNVEYEIYWLPYGGTSNVQHLHTDNCKHLDISIDHFNDDDILDYELVSPKDYNNTLLANCGYYIEENTILVIIVDTNFDKLEEINN